MVCFLLVESQECEVVEGVEGERVRKVRHLPQHYTLFLLVYQEEVEVVEEVEGERDRDVRHLRQ